MLDDADVPFCVLLAGPNAVIRGVDLYAVDVAFGARDRPLPGLGNDGVADPPGAVRFSASLAVSNVVEL